MIQNKHEHYEQKQLQSGIKLLEAAPGSVVPAPSPRLSRREAWAPFNDRGSLYRALQDLAREGTLAAESFGDGGAETSHRKTGTSHSPPES